jgi:8-oxo-dGTP diphosphatase
VKTPPQHIAAAVIINQGRVLLIRRSVPEGHLIWQLPAGKIAPGESPAQAAVRETREETGLEVAAGKLLGERLHPLTDRHITYIACTAVHGTAHVAAPEEVAKVAWVGLHQLPAAVPFGLFPPVQAYLEAVMPG